MDRGRQFERRQDALGGPVSRERMPGSGHRGRLLSPYAAAMASTYRCCAGKSIDEPVLRPAHDRCSMRHRRDRAATDASEGTLRSTYRWQLIPARQERADLRRFNRLTSLSRALAAMAKPASTMRRV